MSIDTASGGLTCGCLGCTKPAFAVIDHPKHGHRTVCEDHVGSNEVVRRV